jgi:hypothetical protein
MWRIIHIIVWINRINNIVNISGAHRVMRDIQALNVTWDSALAEAVSDWGELPDVYWHKRTQLAWN